MSKKPDINVGITAGVKYWLFFMLAFALLSYGPFLSITFGAIGGIACGTIAAWLKPKDEYAPTPAEQKAKHDEETKAPEPPRRVRFRKYGTAPVQRQHQKRGIRPIGWFFRKKS